MKRIATAIVIVALGLLVGNLVARKAKAEAPAAAAPQASPATPAAGPFLQPAPPTAVMPEGHEAEPEPGVIIDDHERVYFPRPADEWQGMLVELTMQAECETSAQCGMAMQCQASHRCGPCQRDSECAAGEQCSMDHCVKRELASCRTRRDCRGEALCVLSGYSSDPRGNSDLRAVCLDPEGASPFAAPPEDEAVAHPANPADETFGPRALLNDLMKDEE